MLASSHLTQTLITTVVVFHGVTLECEGITESAQFPLGLSVVQDQHPDL